MKKLIALLTLVLFTFVGCEKQSMNEMEPKEKPEQTHQPKTGLDTAIEGEYIISDAVPTPVMEVQYFVQSNEPIKKLEYIAPINKGDKGGNGQPTYFDTFSVCGKKEFSFTFKTRYTANFSLLGTVSKNASLDAYIIAGGDTISVETSYYKNIFKDFKAVYPKENAHFIYKGHSNNDPKTNKTGNQKQHK